MIASCCSISSREIIVTFWGVSPRTLLFRVADTTIGASVSFVAATESVSEKATEGKKAPEMTGANQRNRGFGTAGMGVLFLIIKRYLA